MKQAMSDRHRCLSFASCFGKETLPNYGSFRWLFLRALCENAQTAYLLLKIFKCAVYLRTKFSISNVRPVNNDSNFITPEYCEAPFEFCQIGWLCTYSTKPRNYYCRLKWLIKKFAEFHPAFAIKNDVHQINLSKFFSVINCNYQFVTGLKHISQFTKLPSHKFDFIFQHHKFQKKLHWDIS